MRRAALVVFAGALVAGCGGSSSTSHTVVKFDAGDASGIPDPGTSDQVNVAFVDVEPNDTPEQATPLGIAKSGDVVVWVANNTVGGPSNPADYFVFESGPVASNFEFDMCFSSPITGMTAGLWKVEDATAQMPPVATWTITDSCAPSFMAPLDASSEYLFGVLATGGPGLYTA